MSRQLLFLLLILLVSCTRGNRTDETSHRNDAKHTIGILPFNGVDLTLVKKIKSGLEQRLTTEVTILDQQKLPQSAYYRSRNRYIADSLLLYLSIANQERFDKIIGVTVADISTAKKPYINWGVMGLGYCPGEACVISSYRVKATANGSRHFINRMIVLAMHELGHTYSLPHCSSRICIMKDAEGRMNLDNGNTYCINCAFYLKRKGILKQE
ncbi:MAG TPA: hypothetical protein VIZ28_13285 [Chitinophagaceae bacterium]